MKGDPWYRRLGIRHTLGTIVTALSFFSRGAANRLPGSDVLRTSLQRDLRDEGATLEFLVQRWPDLSKLPVWAIENGTRRWEGKWERVARIEIPAGQNDVGSETNLEAAERITFTGTAFFFISSRIGAIAFSEIPSETRDLYSRKTIYLYHRSFSGNYNGE